MWVPRAAPLSPVRLVLLGSGHRGHRGHSGAQRGTAGQLSCAGPGCLPGKRRQLCSSSRGENPSPQKGATAAPPRPQVPRHGTARRSKQETRPRSRREHPAGWKQLPMQNAFSQAQIKDGSAERPLPGRGGRAAQPGSAAAPERATRSSGGGKR